MGGRRQSTSEQETGSAPDTAVELRGTAAKRWIWGFAMANCRIGLGHSPNYYLGIKIKNVNYLSKLNVMQKGKLKGIRQEVWQKNIAKIWWILQWDICCRRQVFHYENITECSSWKRVARQTFKTLKNDCLYDGITEDTYKTQTPGSEDSENQNLFINSKRIFMA